jgi:hypothetical protein
MSESRAVGTQEFHRALTPMVDALTTLANAVDAVEPRHAHLPSEGSQAMRERAAEASYRERSSWQNPITDTHLFGGFTLRAAADYVRTFALAFTTATTPVYGHLVVARAALESSVVSEWLNEPDIAELERIRRGLCE